MAEAADDDHDEGARDYVTALARGLSVMKAFSDQTERLTLSDVARIVNLPRASVRRALFTLEALGYVESAGIGLAASRITARVAGASQSTSPGWDTRTRPSASSSHV